MLASVKLIMTIGLNLIVLNVRTPKLCFNAGIHYKFMLILEAAVLNCRFIVTSKVYTGNECTGTLTLG